MIRTIHSACQELRTNEQLLMILKYTLELGNALNDGTVRGGACGFRVNILLKLCQVKASDNSFSLLNFLAKLLREKCPETLTFDQSLLSLEQASRVTHQVLKAGQTAITKAVALATREQQAHQALPVVSTDRFQAVVAPFVARAQAISDQVDTELHAMNQELQAVVTYFGEDPTSPEMGPDSFFNLFSSFGKMLATADRENERKRIAQERQRRREQDLASTKKAKGFDALKQGNVQDIVKKIRHKRGIEKRQEHRTSFCASPRNQVATIEIRN